MGRTLDETALGRLFPLHFVVDGQLRFVRTTARLSQLVPEAVEGAPLDGAFQLVRPRTALSFENLSLLGNVSVAFQARGTGLVLRGQVVVAQPSGHLVVMVSPQVTDTAALAAFKLKLTDFAPHDSRLDLLLMMAARDAALRDAERMAQQLVELHRKEAERAQALESEIVKQERVASLGRVVAGVAHEVNTPLGVAVTAASIAQEAVLALDELARTQRLKRSDLDRLVSETSEALSTLQLNLRRAAELVRQFKEVAVDQAGGGARRIELGGYVEEALVALRPLLKRSSVQLTVEREAPVSLVTRPGAISQLVTNFVQNALLHAFAPGAQGRIRIGVSSEPGFALLEVRDDGRGMAPEVAAHAFEPFFTTLGGGGGSGLGLFVVHNLVVDALGGTITLDSAPGRGTTFRVRIPMNAPPEAT